MPTPKTAVEIRKSFIEFFEKKEHLFVRSAPVVPQDDPTLMFINAGMNQFKNIFLGDNPKGYKRAVNSQKCIRVSGKHNDLDEVGRDTYHHTLFEMLGNWSFGDYYKKEAISWAWELLTEEWKLSKDRLFVTVYKDDDEAAEIWKTVSGLPDDRIMRFGEAENFWEMGDVGPCGPCSEIHYDKGDIETQEDAFRDKIKGVNGENDRFIEIWNLVFIQYERQTSRELIPLQNKHVDTGMGFERICAILQDVHSNYDTDVFSPIISKIAELSGVPYNQGIDGMPHRVIADHLRTISFAVADGAMPSNEGRGYILRRILRRASRYARLLNQKEAFIYKLLPTLIELMGDAFPEIKEREEFISKVISSEEERFIKTLGTGLDLFEKIVKKSDSQKIIAGEDVFALYDTYGFPPDLTRILAEEKGLSIDEEGFEKSMKEQRDRARAAQKNTMSNTAGEGWVVIKDIDSTDFLGYDKNTAKINVARFRDDDGIVSLIAESSPFYAESGGQVGETGVLSNDLVTLHVFDTIKVNNAWIHKAKVLNGEANEESLSLPLTASVDLDKRSATCKNHSATHLLQAALQEILGDHVAQQGSRVSAESLRFDFSHFDAMTSEEVMKVEALVNQKIQENLVVNTVIQDLEEAKKSGAMALFGEKYEDDVRVVSMDGFSKELCGGLHVERSGNIGAFRILFETSVAAGVRRIEAVSGLAAILKMQEDSSLLETLRSKLKCKPEQLINRFEKILEANKILEKEKHILETEIAKQKLSSILTNPVKVGNFSVWVKELEGVDSKSFKSIVDSLADSLPSEGIAVLGLKDGEQGSLAAVVSPQIVKQGIKAGNVIKVLAEIAGGRGGGRPDRAQAGTKEVEKISLALDAAISTIEGML